jgi:hypothetical protein
MELLYNPKSNPICKSNRFRMAKVLIQSGLNPLTDDQLKALQSHPDYDLMVNSGAFMTVAKAEPLAPTEPVKRSPRKKTSNPILLDTLS